MSVANAHSTTRRAVFALAAAPAIVAAIPASDTDTRREFIERLARIHPNGRFVATKSMALGLNPGDCHLITLQRPGRRHEMPELHFQRSGSLVVVNACEGRL